MQVFQVSYDKTTVEAEADDIKKEIKSDMQLYLITFLESSDKPIDYIRINCMYNVDLQIHNNSSILNYYNVVRRVSLDTDHSSIRNYIPLSFRA